MRIADLRREYDLTSLRRSDLEIDPFAQFEKWFQQAAQVQRAGRIRRFIIGLYKLWVMNGGVPAAEVNAMTLATADKEGMPSARTVLLKGVDARGFVFFTNYESRKGHELAENPHAALVFYWADQARQICVAGDVMKIPREESDAYFKSRPRRSRLSAWASHQSETVRDESVLDRHWKALEREFEDKEIPAPPYWGGYVLRPTRIEFWQGRPNRFHDRFCFVRLPDNRWRLDRLYP